MKKKLIKLIAPVLALLLLCSCGYGASAVLEGVISSFGVNNRIAHGEIPHFNEIQYERPELGSLRLYKDELTAAIDDGASFSELVEILDKCYDEYYNFYTMYNYADVRFCQNLTDEYYKTEYSWCQENFAQLQQIFEEIYYECAACDKAKELENLYFWPGFAEEYSDMEQSVYNDRVVELLTQEGRLIAQFRELTASPTITVDGEEKDFYSYSSELYGAAYDEALNCYYDKYNQPLADIYIQLVKVRTELARILGFESYEQMQYNYYFERDYSPEEAEGYLQNIRKYMVPTYEKVMAALPYNNVSYDYISSEKLYSVLKSCVEKMGGEPAAAFDFMSEFGFYDISVSELKAAMSFQTYFTEYEAPFLFLNSCGDVTDILSFAHEFGHYLDAFYNYNEYETVDLSECYSQAMEFLALNYMNEALTEDEIENLYRVKMLDAIELYVQQASFAEFEHRVYEMNPDELNAEWLNELSLQLAEDYGYLEPGREQYYAMSWTDIVHFFEMPFYVISYPVSNDIAMQIYELERQKEGLGLEKYMEILPREYTGIIDTAVNGGLESPFAPGRIEQVSKDLEEILLNDGIRAAAA